jgi:hypothetical protein|tara:strand:+ start:10929 stop:11405 length:477 start_codon:yes stop_codon:yes gene_type:complete
MVKAKKAPAIPLKDVMAAIDKKDRGFYDRLTAEQKKAFSAWMMMRYCSSVQGRDAANYIFMTNELVNYQFMEVSKHPELQWLLLSACGVGKIQFHPYLKPPNSKKKKNKVTEFLYELNPHMKAEDIQILVDLNTKEELQQLAQEHGYDDKSIKDIFGK